MIWIDYTLIILILTSAFIGLLRGFVKEIMSLIVWATAIWIGLAFNQNLAPLFEQSISYPSARIIVAFAILFFITLILGAIFSHLLSELIGRTGLTGINRFIGMCFGLIRGFIVTTIAVVLARFTPLPEDTWWKESFLIPHFQEFVVWLQNNMLPYIQDYINY